MSTTAQMVTTITVICCVTIVSQLVGALLTIRILGRRIDDAIQYLDNRDGAINTARRNAELAR